MAIFRFLVIALTTFFYVGYLPLIPGTFGSLAGAALFYLIRGSLGLHLLAVCVLIILGFLFAGEAEKIIKTKDPRCIVIDEVSGMLLAFLFVPFDIKTAIIGFFLFRVFDSLKPYPIGRLEKLKGSAGIMCDDIMAGLYTNIVLQVVLRLASFKTS